MRALLFTIIILILCFHICAFTRRSDNLKCKFKSTTGLCKRHIEFTEKDDAYTYSERSHAVCKEPGSSALVEIGYFSISDKILPAFTIKGFTKANDTHERYSATLVFLGSFEYQEESSPNSYDSNSAGYDPTEGDTIIKSSAISFANSKSHLWTPLSITQTNVDGGDNDVDSIQTTITFSSTGTLLTRINITFIVDFVGEACTLGDTFLSPNSTKLSVIVNNYSFSSGSSGIVLEALLIDNKKVKDHGRDDKGHHHVSIQDNDADDTGGYFTWDTQAFSSFTGSGMANVYVSSFSEDTSIDISGYTSETGNVEHFYFTLSNNGGGTFIWDPTIGYIDNPIPSSGLNIPLIVGLSVGLSIGLAAAVIGGVLAYKYKLRNRK